MTLYYKTTCPYSLRIRLILAEKLVPFSRRVVNGDAAPAELADLSGGEVPVLVDGSFAVTDSMVIAEYLEDAFPKPALRPFDARGRAVIRMAMRRIDEALMQPMVAFEKGRTGTDNGNGVGGSAQIFQALSTWDHKLGDNALLLGMEFSLADVWLVSVLETARRLGWNVTAGLPKLSRFEARMSERASVRTERLAS